MSEAKKPKAIAKVPENKDKFLKAVTWILIIFGTIGIIASFALTYDKIKVLENANYVPSCNISPILSCGDIMKTKQASLFGVPNTIFGLIGYSMMVTVGFAMLAKAKFERWFWLAMEGGVILAFGFIHYLFFEGAFRIHAICPFCFVTWTTTAPIFWYVTVHNIQSGNIRFPDKIKGVKTFILDHHLDLFVLWYVLLFGILLQHFWYYWKTLI